MTELVGPFGTMPQEHRHPEKAAKLDHVVQLKCGEVHTLVSYKRNQNMGKLHQTRNKNDPLSDEL